MSTWGTLARGPERTEPCWSCGATPTRRLHATRGVYCARHCRSLDLSVAAFLVFMFVILPVLVIVALAT
jgi:hypothetical protein